MPVSSGGHASECAMWMLRALNRLMDDMMKDSFIKSVASTVWSVIATMLGGVATLATVLFILWACDFFLGFLRAWKSGNINGQKMLSGGLKAIFYTLSVLVMAGVEQALKQYHITLPVRDFYLAFLCIHEALSCMDHLAVFGVPFPEHLRERLKGYHDNLFNEKKQ